MTEETKVVRRRFKRSKFCKLCADNQKAETRSVVDYKDANLLHNFMTERGKIIPRRISGNCATCQRKLTKAIKRARQIGLVPYTFVG